MKRVSRGNEFTSPFEHEFDTVCKDIQHARESPGWVCLHWPTRLHGRLVILAKPAVLRNAPDALAARYALIVTSILDFEPSKTL